MNDTFVYEITPKEGAKVESTFTIYDNTGKTYSSHMYNISHDSDRCETVGSYIYGNANGERFLAFAFDGGLMSETLFRSYAKVDQINNALPYLAKTRALPLQSDARRR